MDSIGVLKSDLSPSSVILSAAKDLFHLTQGKLCEGSTHSPKPRSENRAGAKGFGVRRRLGAALIGGSNRAASRPDCLKMYAT